jgi:hypothetical protein
MTDAPTPPLTLNELPELRRRTGTISQVLRQQIAVHLETLRPLFAPERVFGRHAGGKVEIPGAERALTELQQSYRPFITAPFHLPDALDVSWLTLVGNALDLHPWEYCHMIESKPITVSSPVRWALNYRTNYTLAQVKEVLAGREVARPEYLRQFVVNALVLQQVLTRNPGLVRLFTDLHYEFKTETPEGLRGLPVVTLTSGLTSFRPADALIQAATAFSGIPAFVELINLDSARQTKDWLSSQLDDLLK